MIQIAVVNEAGARLDFIRKRNADQNFEESIVLAHGDTEWVLTEEEWQNISNTMGW